MLKHLIAASLCCMAVTAAAQTMTFETYYPNRVDKVLIFDYSSTADGVSKWSYQGTLTRLPSDPDTRDNRTYETVIHATQGLPDFFPKEWQTFHRETDRGLYTGQLGQDGQMEEHLEFPIEAEAGKPWPGGSDFWETETATPVAKVDTAAGSFEGCVRVERYRQDEGEGAATRILTNATTYCPDIGSVHDVVELHLPDFHSITELKLKEIKP